jgi:hypothetical protein
MPLIAPNGELWVERSVSATVAPLWDVFDASGLLVRRYQAPNGGGWWHWDGKPCTRWCRMRMGWRGSSGIDCGNVRKEGCHPE